MIYENPNHPVYGPCRRLHLKLVELFGDKLADVETAYELGIGMDWTKVMESALAFNTPEQHVARSILKTMLQLLDTLHCQMAADRVAFFKGNCRRA